MNVSLLKETMLINEVEFYLKVSFCWNQTHNLFEICKSFHEALKSENVNLQ